MKICNRCHIEKEDSEFRVRTENRRGSKCRYLNNNCKNCDRELAAIYLNKIKDTYWFKEKNRANAKSYNLKNKDLIAQKRRIKRQTPEYKEYVKAYIQKNKNVILAGNRERNNRYVKKNVDEISDTYAKRTILAHTPNIKSADIPLSLIKAKQIILTIKREVKNGTYL